MNKIDLQLDTLKKRGKTGLMTHMVIGYPSIRESLDIIIAMAEAGADFIELQIPFSDPLADGPTIMRACEVSLEKGTRVKDAFTLMRKASKEVLIPLLFMSYYNMVFKYGVERFCRDAAAAGAQGLIVPDMPIDEEENEHFYALARKYNLHAIHVLSPASTPQRLAMNKKSATGFVYATAKQGTTGAQENLSETLGLYIRRLKTVFSIPIAIGFGISKKEHMKVLKEHGVVAIIGSALMEVIAKSSENTRKQEIIAFISNLY